MKRFLIACALLSVFGPSMAQEVMTDSVRGSEANGATTTSAVTQTAKRATATKQQNVTKGELNFLIGEIKGKLGKLDRMNSGFSAVGAAIGARDIEEYEDYVKFNGHGHVDLGLKDSKGKTIYWASCNLGAENPEDYGNYYAWGETKAWGEYDISNTHLFQERGTYEKTINDWNTYKYCTGATGETINKYTVEDCMKSGCWYDNDTFVGDGKHVLDPEDDAAAVNWGASWRMPTDEEVDQLCEKCTWTWTTLNGVAGCEVKGPNGNTIFLPAAGWRQEGDFKDVGVYGHYWFSKIDPYSSDCAYFLFFGDCFQAWSMFERCNGRPVRPVFK